jgi:hypothetical protein
VTCLTIIPAFVPGEAPGVTLVTRGLEYEQPSAQELIWIAPQRVVLTPLLYYRVAQGLLPIRT